MLSRLIVQTQPMMSKALVGRNFQKMPTQNQIVRQINNEGRGTISGGARVAQRKGLQEKTTAPAGKKTFTIGKCIVIAGSALGLGALCYYGLGIIENQPYLLDNSILRPQYVRERIQDSYVYFGSTVAITAASATAIFRTPALMNFFARTGWISMIATIALILGSGMVARSIPYEMGVGTKQLAWAAHCTSMGAFLAKIAFVGGPIFIHAAWYTAGIAGGLSTVAACAPNDRFMYMGGYMGIVLGVAIAASLGSIFLPPTTALGAGLCAMSLYSGLLHFSAFLLLYDTQRMVRRAENHPEDDLQKYDPINAAMSIYMDTLNKYMEEYVSMLNKYVKTID